MASTPEQDAAAHAEAAALYALIGHRISRWSLIEAALVGVLARLVGPFHDLLENRGSITPPGNPASTIFYAIEGMRARQSIIAALMKLRLGEKDFEAIKPSWTKLVRHLDQRSKWRNRLAHWNVMAFPLEVAGRRAMLVPPLGSPDGAAHTGERYSSADIEAVGPLFEALYDEVRDFAEVLGSQQKIREHFAASFAGLLSSYVHNRSTDMVDYVERVTFEQFKDTEGLPEWLQRPVDDPPAHLTTPTQTSDEPGLSEE